jgi:hypothetical protein
MDGEHRRQEGMRRFVSPEARSLLPPHGSLPDAIRRRLDRSTTPRVQVPAKREFLGSRHAARRACRRDPPRLIQHGIRAVPGQPLLPLLCRVLSCLSRDSA